ncbi:hypothetical protein [Mucilaginibacter sp.]|uniref:hypothetical protein n=1 Tax=Mucilaginibacter sp. TaxID=1882438 RepID=UPI002627BA2A|nr:hypothetical protein [Mucilaginibacter sp.]
MSETEIRERHVLIELPHNLERTRRIKKGLSTSIAIDGCIVEDIIHLWRNGIITTGCCCGHNGYFPRMVNVNPESVDKMYSMGYEQFHNDYTFKI